MQTNSYIARAYKQNKQSVSTVLAYIISASGHHLMCEGTNKAFADHEALDKKAFEVHESTPLMAKLVRQKAGAEIRELQQMLD